jgi:hypothetical protein
MRLKVFSLFALGWCLLLAASGQEYGYARGAAGMQKKVKINSRFVWVRVIVSELKLIDLIFC